MILFWILYRKVSLKYHRSVIGALMAFYRKSYGFSSKHQSVFLSKTTQIPLKFQWNTIIDKLFCISITSVSYHDCFCSCLGYGSCPLGASSVPHLSEQRYPIGQASCPFLCLFDLFFWKACRFIIILQLGISFRTFKLSSRTYWLCVDTLRDLHLNDNAAMGVFLKLLKSSTTCFLHFYINLFCIKKILCNFAKSKKWCLCNKKKTTYYKKALALYSCFQKIAKFEWSS